jgi:hypothetical protein
MEAIIFLPGSRHPIHDLEWLKKRHRGCLKQHAAEAYWVSAGLPNAGDDCIGPGWCGGAPGTSDGLGLLPVKRRLRQRVMECHTTGGSLMYQAPVDELVEDQQAAERRGASSCTVDTAAKDYQQQEQPWKHCGCISALVVFTDDAYERLRQ